MVIENDLKNLADDNQITHNEVGQFAIICLVTKKNLNDWN